MNWNWNLFWIKFALLKFWSYTWPRTLREKYPYSKLFWSVFPCIQFENKALGCEFIDEETLAQVFSCEFCDIFKNTFCYRTPLVAASVS